jgi:hypothetical protein
VVILLERDDDCVAVVEAGDGDADDDADAMVMRMMMTVMKRRWTVTLMIAKMTIITVMTVE